MRFLCSFCEKVLERDECTFGDSTLCDHCQKETLTPASRIALGVVIDDFVIMEAMGEGRICTLHLAYQLSLHRQVILQLLKRELLQNHAYVDQFIMDARCMARFLHPHIIHAYSLGEYEEMRFAAVEYLEGFDLGAILTEHGPLPPYCAMTLMKQIAEAIGYVWQEHHMLHRDIKPTNIFLADANIAKLTGFRLACKATDLADDQQGDAIVGTAPYMSPEHILGGRMDARSDLYSLGATFYHLMTGRMPFRGRSAQEIAHMHLTEEPTPACQLNPQIPEVASTLLQRLMAKELDARFDSAADLCQAIDAAQRSMQRTGTGDLRASQLAETGVAAWRNPATILD